MSSDRQNPVSQFCKSSKYYHVVLFPFMAKGHSIPLIHLAHLLLGRGITVTVFTTQANHAFIADLLSNTSASIIDLPFPNNIPEIPSGIEGTDRLPSMSLFPAFALATKLMQPDFDSALENLSPVSFMVTDAFLWWTAESAAKFDIPRLVFSGMSNYTSCVSKFVAESNILLGPESNDDLVTLTEFPWIKLCRNDFEPALLNHDMKDPHFEFLLKVVMASTTSYGCISDSFYELESVFVDYWNRHNKQITWCVGPLCLAKETSLEIKNQNKPIWIHWLDEKLKQGISVLYVAFGSQADVSTEQLKEIAIGLEESNVNFLWAMRNKESELPDGFEERIKETGLIVRDWVDQRVILKHPSVGGFLSHCGWNSVLESICSGVPILAWPMMAEQPLNARMVVEEIKVGLRLETCNESVKGFVKSESLRKNVNELMEGETGREVKKKVKQVEELAKKAMEKGSGSSWRTLDMLIKKICAGRGDVNP